MYFFPIITIPGPTNLMAKAARSAQKMDIK